jgi:hypothetical protein
MGPVLKFFRYCTSIFLVKSVFFAVEVSLHWLNNVSGVYLFQVPLLLIG